MLELKMMLISWRHKWRPHQPFKFECHLKLCQEEKANAFDNRSFITAVNRFYFNDFSN